MKQPWQSLSIVPMILGAALGADQAAAQEFSAEETSASLDQSALGWATELGQLRSVSQLSDLRPTDWSYQAIRALVERYNCVAGYPDGTFRGNRALTRAEAAALVNACMDTVNDLITAATATAVTDEDLAILQRLQEEFQAELATLRGRVDTLEARTAELEANQFSTTTQIQGEVIFSLNDTLGDNVDGSGPDADNAVFGSRIRLGLSTSFSGEDLLYTRLFAGNVGDRSGQLEYATDTVTGNEVTVRLDDLWYRFPVGDRAEIQVGPMGMELDEITPTTGWEYGGFADFLEGAWTMYDDVSEWAGLGGNYQITETVNIAAAYLSGQGSDEPEFGFFNDDWSAFTQLSVTKDRFQMAVSYLHEYDKDSDDGFFAGLGTLKSQDPFAGADAATLDEVGIGLSYQVTPNFLLSAFGTYAWLKDQVNGDFATAYSAGLGLVFPDLFGEGHEGGIALGINPTIVSNENAIVGTDSSIPLIVDAYFNYRISDAITITPGGFVLLNQATDASPVGVFALKTTFSF